MKEHISVCVCTFKRHQLLERLLRKLEDQVTEGLFSFSVVVVDNDASCSAKSIVERAQASSKLCISYYNEPRQNIALARNKAVEVSDGDFIAFIDDDEIPESNWLLSLHIAINKFAADGVLGPVLPQYGSRPPKWVIRGRFFERPRHRTGQAMKWENARTGNALIKKRVFESNPPWFRPEFGSGGEDRDFFQRKIEQGFTFVWCNEAVVFEYIPPARWKMGVQIKRSLLRGRMACIRSRLKLTSFYASAVASVIYGISLPFLWVFSPLIGYEFFFKYLIAWFDHLGKLLALFNIDIIKAKYITTK
jgi:glycosyltransferase involved in cell wall biosynthesis